MAKDNILIINQLKNEVTLQHRYEGCYNCQYNNVSIPGGSSYSFNSSPKFRVDFSVISNGSSSSSCQKNYFIHGSCSYNFTICKLNQNPFFQCMFNPISVDDYLPLYILFISLSLTAVLYYVLLLLYRNRFFQKIGSKLFMYQVDSLEDLGNPRKPYAIMTDDDSDGLLYKRLKSSSRKRIKAVDTFRGISIVLMVFVNYGGGQYSFFDHSSWNGLTVADLVFPWFTFVMGVTISIRLFKLSKMMKLQWLKLWLETVRRCIILFIIGIGLGNPKSQLQKLRIMGPLQRLAIAYLILLTCICLKAFIMKIFKCQTEFSMDYDILESNSEINLKEYRPIWSKCKSIAPDIVQCFPFIVITFILLVSHACISLFIPFDNCPKGYLGPGGEGDYGQFTNCTGGIAGFIDRYILTENHMYTHETSKPLYNSTQPFDPEGILGCLTCTSVCFFGYWAGSVMLLNREWPAISKRLIIYAVVCAAIGTGLCEGKLNGGLIPINKNLWSVSYALITSGMSFLILAILFVMIDALKFWSGAPFKYPGTNPIVVYVGHSLLHSTFPVQWKVSDQYNHYTNIIMNTWGAVFWTLIGFIMHLKKLTITV